MPGIRAWGHRVIKVDESANFIGSRLMSLKQAQPHRKCSRITRSCKIPLIRGRFCIYAKPQKSERKGLKKRRQSHPDMEAYSPAHRESATSVSKGNSRHVK